MTLLNAEYALGLQRAFGDAHGTLRLLLLFDAGRVRGPFRGPDDWMKGVGFGIQTGPLRFEWAWDAERNPRSGQFFLRLGRGF